jgi:uncharacterized protein (TIGR02186 family)
MTLRHARKNWRPFSQWRALVLGALAMGCMTNAQAQPLVSDISSHRVAIDSQFTGTSLLFFGAQQRPGDLLVVMRGPEARVTVRRKSRVLGMWVNRRSTVLEGIPLYYHLAATRPLQEMGAHWLLTSQQLGLPSLRQHYAVDGDMEYIEAFQNYQAARGLYDTAPGPIGFMGETLFRTPIDFPASLPRGTYTAEAYLLQNGRLVAMQSTPLLVAKRGFDAMVYDTAHRYPLFYGLLAVMIAVTVGWTASHLFRRL